LQDVLNGADKLKLSFSKRTDLMKTITRALVKEYAHQSTAVEGNPLRIGDSLIIEDGLKKQLSLTLNDLAGMNTKTLANLTLPSPDILLPNKDLGQVAELRNHISLAVPYRSW